ncbi:MAG: deoxyribonuclease V [Alphaproteobacteria bacterium]
MQYIQPTAPADARRIQNELREQLHIADEMGAVRLIAGIDVGYDKRNNQGRASISLIRPDDLTVQGHTVAQAEVLFPYVPGLLSFRELPVILKALQQLRQTPDLFMVDGQGIAHPRRMGIAAHLGLVMDMPSIGVAKSRLTGSYDEPADEKGATSLLMDKGERIGTVLRSKKGCKPLFISPGHRVGHDTALKVTLACLTRYRLPEPTRIADKLSKTGSRSDEHYNSFLQS